MDRCAEIRTVPPMADRMTCDWMTCVNSSRYLHDGTDVNPFIAMMSLENDQ